MRLAPCLASLMLCGVVPQVHAHAHLRHSSPAEGAVLSVAPTQVTLTLSEPARLTAAWIQRGDEPRRKLAPPQQAAPEVSLALPALVPGEYLVSWRALSADGHVTSGSLHFKLASPGGPAHP